jgi:hypothetical protein
VRRSHEAQHSEENSLVVEMKEVWNNTQRIVLLVPMLIGFFVGVVLSPIIHGFLAGVHRGEDYFDRLEERP